MGKALQLFERYVKLRNSDINLLKIFSGNYFTFDTRSAMLWFNPDWDVTRSEAEDLLKLMNADTFNGRRYEWRFPTDQELEIWHGDRSALSNTWISDGCVRNEYYYNGCYKLRRESPETAHVVFISSSLKPENYSFSYQAVVDIFLKNNITPPERFTVEIEIAKILSGEKLESKPVVPAPTKLAVPEIPAKIDYKTLLAKYDAAAIDSSPIQYSAAVIKFADEVLAALQEYETAQSEAIAEILRVSTQLNAPYEPEPALTAEENALILERRQFRRESKKLIAGKILSASLPPSTLNRASILRCWLKMSPVSSAPRRRKSSSSRRTKILPGKFWTRWLTGKATTKISA